MKKIIVEIIIIVLIGGMCIMIWDTIKNSNHSDNSSYNEEKTSSNNNELKSLIVFFSRAGENYGVGNIEVGNTEVFANYIQEYTNGDLFKLDPVISYPTNYEECTEVASKEKSENARPEYKGSVDVNAYDVIYIGYPIWWGDMPMLVYTFLENNNLDGKIIIPFNTHEGSGESGTYANLKNKYPNSNVLGGLSITGTTIRNSKDKVISWLQGIDEIN